MYGSALITLLTILSLAGCATSAKQLAYLEKGMSKTQVIEILGEPKSVMADETQEVLLYDLDDGEVLVREYWVRFTDGKLYRYERATSSKNKIDVNVRTVQ